MERGFVGAAMLAAILGLPMTAAAGPIFLTGHDPDFHAQSGGAEGAGAQDLLEAGLNFATGGTFDDGGQRFLWVESDMSAPGGHRRGVDALGTLGLSEGVHYDHMDAAGLAGLNFSDYSAIAVASSFGGTLTRAELDALIARSADIVTFVNAGGGIFAAAECFPCGANLLGGDSAPDLFGFLPIEVSAIFNDPPYTVTAYGADTFGLDAGDVNAPSHNAFADAAGLNVVDVDGAGNAMTLAGIVRIDDGGFDPIDVPEPASLVLFASAAMMAGGLRRRRR